MHDEPLLAALTAASLRAGRTDGAEQGEPWQRVKDRIDPGESSDDPDATPHVPECDSAAMPRALRLQTSVSRSGLRRAAGALLQRVFGADPHRTRPIRWRPRRSGTTRRADRGRCRAAQSRRRGDARPRRRSSGRVRFRAHRRDVEPNPPIEDPLPIGRANPRPVVGEIDLRSVGGRSRPWPRI
jgi:hypothetical protein